MVKDGARARDSFKRRTARARVDPLPEEIEIDASVFDDSALRLSADVFSAKGIIDRERLIDLVWTGDYVEILTAAIKANPDTVAVLAALSGNSYSGNRVPERYREAHARHRFNLFTGIFAVLNRAKSQHNVPLLTVLLSLRAYKLKVHQRFLDAMACFFRGSLMGDTWTERFIRDAMSRDPGPRYSIADGVGLAAFDNLTIQVGYKSYSADGQTGFRLDMTNWAKIPIPRSLFSAQNDIRAIWREGLFPRRLSASAFSARFESTCRDVARNRDARFARFLDAARDGTLFDRPDYVSPWRAHVDTMPAIFGLLQGAYDDVEQELAIIRSHYKDTPPYQVARYYFLFLGGDGLTFERTLHLMAQHQDIYLDVPPAIIPVLGVAPHGEYHVMHAGYRNFKPIIRVFADHLNNPQLVDDPNVSQYNMVRHGISVIMRACCEYLVDLSKTPGAETYDMATDFIEACERNIDTAWVVHLLYDFLFLWWDFKQAVRANDSRHLDTLWAEFVPLGRTTIANKTHYGVLATMQVYLGMALHPALAKLYHEIRTVNTGGGPGTNTGLDMIVERINLALKQDVTHQISQEQINRRLADHRLLDIADAGLERIVAAMRETAKAKMKDVDADVAKLKTFLRAKVGADWRRATRVNTKSALGLDGRALTPWEALRRSYTHGVGGGEKTAAEYALEHAQRLAPWQRWA